MKSNELAVKSFNEKYPVGTKVKVRRDAGDFLETTVSAPADLLGGHTPVVWLLGLSGCYLLNRVMGIE